MMVGAALCFSLAAPFAKLSVQSANPYFAFGVAQIIAVAGSAGWLAAVGFANFLQAIATYIARSVAVGSLMIVGILLLSFQS